MEGSDPFTPSRLLEIADIWERVMREKQGSPEAHPDIDFSFAYQRNRNAIGIAAYIDKHSIESRRNIGCFQLDHFREGDVVRLRRRQEFGTTHPSVKGPVKRDRTIKVHRVMPGYATDLERGHRALVMNPKIEWVGTGSYYFWCEVEDVVLANAEAT